MSENSDARQLVVFTVGNEQYALPIQDIREIIRYAPPRPVPSRGGSMRGVISLRGQVIPVLDLAARLGVKSESGEHAKIVIAQWGSEMAGVIVDQVDEVLTVNEDQFEGSSAADPELIDSIAKIGDRLVVQLKPGAIFVGLEELAVT